MANRQPALFVYGTLLFPEILEALLGFVPAGSPAELAGYHRYCIYDGPHPRPYPAIYPAAGHTVEGLLLRGLSGAQMAVLDAYEDEDYVRKPCTVIESGQAQVAVVYVWRADRRGQLRSSWDKAAFEARYLQHYVVRLRGA